MIKTSLWPGAPVLGLRALRANYTLLGILSFIWKYSCQINLEELIILGWGCSIKVSSKNKWTYGSYDVLFIQAGYFKKSGPLLIPFRDFFLQGREIATLYMVFFWMEVYQCSRWVDNVLHCLLHSASWFQGAGRCGFSGGCGKARCAAILQKIRILDVKNK